MDIGQGQDCNAFARTDRLEPTARIFPPAIAAIGCLHWSDGEGAQDRLLQPPTHREFRPPPAKAFWTDIEPDPQGQRVA